MNQADLCHARKQSTSHILLVQPVDFYSNPETLPTNSHQTMDNTDHLRIQNQAAYEHEQFRKMLEKNNIKVTLFKGQYDCPDDVFCNNWVSTHADKTYNLYPILAVNRRLERRSDIINFLDKHYKLDQDLTLHEVDNQFLESTGSIVLDRVNRVAYAVRSPRTDPDLFDTWCFYKGYDPVLFDAYDSHGKPEYHTNVVMFIGSKVAAICAESIPEEQRQIILEKLSKTHDIIQISRKQSASFCGNVLEVQSVDEKRLFLVMSTAAYNAYTKEQKEKLNIYYDTVLHTDIGTIEKYGGGSARCMMLELF